MHSVNKILFLYECSKKGGIESLSVCSVSKIMSVAQKNVSLKKTKEIENMRQDGKITFDEAKRHYF